MISDFSSAYLHHCRRQIPLLELDVRSKTDLGCDEISNVAWTLDLFEKKEFIGTSLASYATRILINFVL